MTISTRFKPIIRRSVAWMNQKLWIVLDSVTNIQSQPLTKDVLQSAILKMSNPDLQRFYLWSYGWNNWHKLADYLISPQAEFYRSLDNYKRNENKKNESVRRANNFVDEQTITKSVTKINPQNQHLEPQASEHVFEQSSGQKIDFKKISEGYRGRAERHELKIEILLVNLNNKSFRSYSQNISLTGSLLEDTIPLDFYDAPFDLVVVNRHSSQPQTSRVQLKAQVVGDGGLTRRVQFINMGTTQTQKLTDLLNEYISNQSKSKTG